MSDHTLKPCPFCGSKTAPKLVEYCAKWYVCCETRVNGCGADFDTFKTRQQAIDAWNRRDSAVVSEKLEEKAGIEARRET